MDREEFYSKLKDVKQTLIDARRIMDKDIPDDFITKLRSAEGFISFIEKYGDNFIFLDNTTHNPIKVKLFESQTTEDMETQVNTFLSFPNRMVIFTGIKGDRKEYFGYVLYK